jgi:hypothetical protein
MKQSSKDLKTKFNLKIKDSSQKSNNSEVNSVSSNEDINSDFNMPIVTENSSKNNKSRNQKQQQSQNSSSSDISFNLDASGNTNLKSFRVRKLSKDSILGPLNFPNQAKPNILPTPKNYHINKANLKKKQYTDTFNSSSMTEAQFALSYNKASDSTGKLNEQDSMGSKFTKSKPKIAPLNNLVNQNLNNLSSNSNINVESNDVNFITKLAVSNKEKFSLPSISKESLDTAGTFQRSMKIPNITPNKPNLINNRTSSILSFNLQPIKVAIQSTSDLIASNFSPALDSFFFPKIYSPSLASSKNSDKKILKNNLNSSSFFNLKSTSSKVDVPQEEFEDLDLNSILYSDAPDFFANDYQRARLSKINEEPSGKNTQLSQNWSTWSGISSALSEIENHNIVAEEIQKKKNNINNIMQLNRPIHQRSKTFYHFEDAYA